MSKSPSGREATEGFEGDSKRVACISCGKDYANGSGLRYHYKNDSNECVGFSCPVCEKNYFMNEAGARQHAAIAHREDVVDDPYVCKRCSKEFASRTSRREHMKECCPGLMVTCPTCERNFMGEKGMKQHHASDHGESIYGVEAICDQCGETTRQRKTRYEKNEHNFCNPDCQNEYYRENGGVREYGTGEDHGKFNSEPYDCDWCGETMMRRRSRIEAHDNLYCNLECASKHRSVLYRGERSPRWKGGAVNYYGPNWQEQRRKALQRDNYTCQDCGLSTPERSLHMHVHHMKRLKWFKDNYESPEWHERGNRLDNLITFCKDCHGKWETIPVQPDLS